MKSAFITVVSFMGMDPLIVPAKKADRCAYISLTSEILLCYNTNMKIIKPENNVSAIARRLQSQYTKHPRGTYYLLYSAVFALLVCFVFFFFKEAGKSFIWVGSPDEISQHFNAFKYGGEYLRGEGKSLIWVGSSDGLSQHYNALMYWGEYLREVFRSLLETGSLTFPMWDTSIGYGADILTTLHYYVIGDPLALLSGFVPASKTEFLYDGLVLLRLYLAGVAFSAFCKKMGKGTFGTLLGSFIYVFSAYALYGGVRHPYFLNPMIYLPLLLLGAEKIFRRERPYFFMAMVFVSAVSNFYFFYMLTIFVALFILFRFFMEQGGRSVKGFLTTFFRFGGYYLIGFLMALFLFLPVAMAMLDSNRVGEGPLLPVFYPGTYYLQLLFSFTGGDWQFKWTCLGFAPVVLLCLYQLFRQRKKQAALKWAVLLGTLFLLFPVFGKILNGFSYSTNRWSFAYAMLIAYVAATMLPALEKLSVRVMGVVAGLAVLYVAAGLIIPDTRTADNAASYLVLGLTVLVLLGLSAARAKADPSSRKRLAAAARICIAVSVLAGVTINAAYRYAPGEGDYVSEFTVAGQAEASLKDNGSAAVRALEDPAFGRFELGEMQSFLYNSALQNRVMGTDSYFSLVNGNVSDYMKEHRFVRANDATYQGLSGRAYLDALAGVKYYVTDSQNPIDRPFGFDTFVSSYDSETFKTTYYVYQSGNALPFGFTYQQVLSTAAYDKLSVTEKAQAQLQGAVVESDIGLPEAKPRFDDRELDYDISFSDGIEQTESGFKVKRKDASVTLTFDSLPDSETYLLFDQLSYYKKGSGASYTTIMLSCDGIQKNLRINTPYYSWYTGNHDFLTNLGYGLSGRQTLTLQFSRTGEYRFDQMRLMAQQMERLPVYTQALQQEVLEQVVFAKNKVSGSITVAQQKLLCLNLPYSKGWSVTVDGQEQELLRVNGMFCGVLLAPGSHQVELRYVTPYLKTGAALSLLGLALAGGTVFFYEKKRKRQLGE